MSVEENSIWKWTVISLRFIAIMFMAAFSSWLVFIPLFETLSRVSFDFENVIVVSTFFSIPGALLGWFCYKSSVNTILMVRGLRPVSPFANGPGDPIRASMLASILVIFIFFAVVVPVGTRMVRLAQERKARDELSTFRSAIGIYSSDHSGEILVDLNELTIDRKYLGGFPLVATGYHHYGNKITKYPTWNPRLFRDTGEWGYINNPDDDAFGRVFVDCTHKTSKGLLWYEY